MSCHPLPPRVHVSRNVESGAKLGLKLKPCGVGCRHPTAKPCACPCCLFLVGFPTYGNTVWAHCIQHTTYIHVEMYICEHTAHNRYLSVDPVLSVLGMTFLAQPSCLLASMRVWPLGGVSKRLGDLQRCRCTAGVCLLSVAQSIPTSFYSLPDPNSSRI